MTTLSFWMTVLGKWTLVSRDTAPPSMNKKVRSDGVHLNGEGIRMLRDYLINTFINAKRGSRSLQAPARYSNHTGQ